MAPGDLDDHGVPYASPTGAFYTMVDITGAGMADTDFVSRLIVDRRVAVVPGSAFGPGSGNFVRVSLATSDDDLRIGMKTSAITLGEHDVAAVMDRLAAFSGVESIIARGETKMSLRLTAGMQVDLRAVPAESFGAALQYFTGSKEHNVALRDRAKRRGCRQCDRAAQAQTAALAGNLSAHYFAVCCARVLFFVVSDAISPSMPFFWISLVKVLR